MGAKIPKQIRQEVIRQWLGGTSRHENARINEVSSGTVSNIIKESVRLDREWLLLREVAVLLKNEVLSLDEIASSIRLYRVLVGIGLKEEEKVETFLENLSIHCFRSGQKETEFIAIINQISSLLHNLKISLDKLPSYIQEKSTEINDIELKEKYVLEKYGVTMDMLEQYMDNKPLIDQNHTLKNQLDKITQERDSLQHKLSRMQSKNFLLKSVCGVSQHELDLAKYGLDTPLDARELYAICSEIFDHPSKNLELINLFKRQHTRK